MTHADVRRCSRRAVLGGAVRGHRDQTAFLPLWFADRGLSAAAIGQVLGLASLLRVIAGPGWGTIADRIGRRRPVMLTAGDHRRAAALLYLPLHGFLPLLLVAAVQGIAASALGPLIDSLALALARERRMEYGPVRSLGSIAYMAASAGAGWLLCVAGTFLVPWLLAAGLWRAAVVTPLLPEAATPPAPRGFAGLRLLAQPAVPPDGDRQRADPGLARGVLRLRGDATGGRRGSATRVIGLLIAEGIIAEIALFACGPRLGGAAWSGGTDGLRRRGIGGALERDRLAPPLPVLAAMQLLHAATFAMQHLSAMLVLSRAVPPERAATAQALHSALGMGAPSGLMMLLAGFLYAHFGGLAFLAMAAIGGSALLLVRPIMRLR